MLDPELLERITARRAELDELEKRLVKQLAEVRAERDELAVAERVFERVSEQLADERASAGYGPGQVGGRAVTLIPHCTPDVEETMLPPDYQRIVAAVRQAAGPVMAREVGEAVGVDVGVRAELVKLLPVSVDRLRQDRILEEALVNGADPLHLAHVFSLGAKTSLRYTCAVTTSAAEQDSCPW